MNKIYTSLAVILTAGAAASTASAEYLTCPSVEQISHKPGEPWQLDAKAVHDGWMVYPNPQTIDYLLKNPLQSLPKNTIAWIDIDYSWVYGANPRVDGYVEGTRINPMTCNYVIPDASLGHPHRLLLENAKKKYAIHESLLSKDRDWSHYEGMQGSGYECSINDGNTSSHSCQFWIEFAPLDPSASLANKVK